MTPQLLLYIIIAFIIFEFALSKILGWLNLKTWDKPLADKLKGIALAIILGGGILALLTFLYGLLGDKFWVAAWIVVSVISIFLAMFYTSFLLPLFNKLTPLENGELRQSIEQYAAKVHF